MKTFHENLHLVSNGFDRAEILISNTNNIQPNTTQYNKFIKYSKKYNACNISTKMLKCGTS